MPGFADNVWRLRQAAGLTADEVASRLGTPVGVVEAFEASGAGLPELHVLVRLADALGCQIDELLEGEDADFDAPERRHAALIAARLGRVRTLMTQVQLARNRGGLTAFDEALVREQALLATVAKCRAWVMSSQHDPDGARRLEAELDAHLARIRQAFDTAMARVDASRPGASARVAAPSTALDPIALLAEPAVAGRDAAHASSDTPSSVAGHPRRRGHRTTLWTERRDDREHRCDMYTRANEVELELLLDDRVVDTRACSTLDEAFRQSSEWRRAFLVPAILAAPPLSHRPVALGQDSAEESVPAAREAS